MAHNPAPDLTRACWRCQHYAGLVAEVHAACTGPHASLQANPRTGCVYWRAGAGDAQLPNWLPPGYVIREKVMIWDTNANPDERAPAPRLDERPGAPTAAAEWDRKHEAQAWRATDALMARARSTP